MLLLSCVLLHLIATVWKALGLLRLPLEPELCVEFVSFETPDISSTMFSFGIAKTSDRYSNP
jgi:hypothetical protein